MSLIPARKVRGQEIRVGDLVVFDFHTLKGLVGLVKCFDGQDPVIEVETGDKWNPWYQLHKSESVHWRIRTVHPGK